MSILSNLKSFLHTWRCFSSRAARPPVHQGVNRASPDPDQRSTDTTSQAQRRIENGYAVFPEDELLDVPWDNKTLRELNGPHCQEQGFKKWANIRRTKERKLNHHCADKRGHGGKGGPFKFKCLTDGHMAYCLEWKQNPPDSNEWVRCGQIFKTDKGCTKGGHYIREQHLPEPQANLLYEYWNSRTGKDLEECKGGLVNRPKTAAELKRQAEAEARQQAQAQLKLEMEKIDEENPGRVEAGELWIDTTAMWDEWHREGRKMRDEEGLRN